MSRSSLSQTPDFRKDVQRRKKLARGTCIYSISTIRWAGSFKTLATSEMLVENFDDIMKRMEEIAPGRGDHRKGFEDAVTAILLYHVLPEKLSPVQLSANTTFATALSNVFRCARWRSAAHPRWEDVVADWVVHQSLFANHARRIYDDEWRRLHHHKTPLAVPAGIRHGVPVPEAVFRLCTSVHNKCVFTNRLLILFITTDVGPATRRPRRLAQVHTSTIPRMRQRARR